MRPSLRKLKAEAREACTYREHKMGNFKIIPTHRGSEAVRENAEATCKICGMEVTVRTHPMPNQIDIGGEAVALTCKGTQT